jgi:hypothetical protein
MTRPSPQRDRFVTTAAPQTSPHELREECLKLPSYGIRSWHVHTLAPFREVSSSRTRIRRHVAFSPTLVPDLPLRSLQPPNRHPRASRTFLRDARATARQYRCFTGDREGVGALNRTLNLRIKSLSCTASLTSGFARILLLTCTSLFHWFRLLTVVSGWLAGFLWGRILPGSFVARCLPWAKSASVVQKPLLSGSRAAEMPQRSLTSLKRSATTRVSSVISMPDQKVSCAGKSLFPKGSRISRPEHHPSPARVTDGQ